jgi:TerC family integral membrane protein
MSLQQQMQQQNQQQHDLNKHSSRFSILDLVTSFVTILVLLSSTQCTTKTEAFHITTKPSSHYHHHHHHQATQFKLRQLTSSSIYDHDVEQRRTRTRLSLGFWKEDATISTTTTTATATATATSTSLTSNANENDSNTVSSSAAVVNKKDDKSSSSPILQPGTGPTIIIDPNETDKEIYQSAIERTVSWVIAAVLFGMGLYLTLGRDTAEEFYAGYLVEQSLSVDNLFVFLLLFDYFNVPLGNQDRVLNYGIYGAIVMRAVMIGLGSVALSQYHGILLVFAGILIYSSATVILGLLNGEDEEEEEDMSENSIVKFSRNLFDSTNEFDGDRFFTIENGLKKATPLFICLVAVEISDVVFAVDSIPAVFGVTEVCMYICIYVCMYVCM